MTTKNKTQKKVFRNSPQKIKVFVAMSGGVDSSVAAALLKQKGYDITGVFMKNWTENCDWQKEKRDAERVCAKLNIPFLVFDFTKEYKKDVLNYALKEYLSGKTPNPDVMCNKKIKFGFFLNKAIKMGANFIATGHYVRLKRELQITIPSTRDKLQINSKFNPPNNRQNYKLSQAKDKNKDQSYFLWTLTQKQLKHCLFPIGDYLKPETRVLAKKFGLPNAEKKDSQGLCFVGKVKFLDFLKNQLLKYLGGPRLKNLRKFQKMMESGPIFTMDKKIIGKHNGLAFYTIGQRRGFGTGGGKIYYVAKKDAKNNVLIVTEKNDPSLYKKEIFAGNLNWINPRCLTSGVKARIRYRQPLQNCEIYDISKNRIKVIFSKPVLAPAPGQSIVFYKNQEMLGGGIIEC